MSSARRHLPFGAELLDAHTGRFRLWAPSAVRVQLTRPGAPPLDMRRDDCGWFEIVTPTEAGSLYRYRIDDALDVPDPASRAQRGGVRGFSVVVDPAAYAWQARHWRGRAWEEAIIYELHVGLYGGYAGVQAALDDLAQLGVTAIELMPIAEFPGRRSWGYDGVLPFAPASAYGSPDELKSLVDAAHGLGLMVILDVVYNHFGPEGNHLGCYAADFFDPSRQTPWGAAIAFDQDAVREFFLENALYWIDEYRFDGLRLDAAHAIGDRRFLIDLGTRTGRRGDSDCRAHVIVENHDNDAGLLRGAFTAQWNDDAHHVLHVLLTGERFGYYGDYADTATTDLARWLAEGFVLQGEARPAGGARRGSPSGDLRPTAFVNCLQNHDQVGNRALGDRLNGRVDRGRLLAAYTLLLLIPQIPMLFMGEDRGLTTPFHYFTDFDAELADAVRAGRQREFAHADGVDAESLPDPNAERSFETSRPERTSDDGVTRLDMELLIELRHRHIVPRVRDARALGATVLGDAAVEARWRMGDSSVLRVAINLGREAVGIADDGEVPLHASAPMTSGTLLPGCCAVWLHVVTT